MFGKSEIIAIEENSCSSSSRIIFMAKGSVIDKISREEDAIFSTEALKLIEEAYDKVLAVRSSSKQAPSTHTACIIESFMQSKSKD